jgi:hypothetical protein
LPPAISCPVVRSDLQGRASRDAGKLGLPGAKWTRTDRSGENGWEQRTGAMP